MKAIKLIAVALLFGASTMSAQAVQHGKTDTTKKATVHKMAKAGTKAHATAARVDVKSAAKATTPAGHPAVAAKTGAMAAKADTTKKAAKKP